MSVNDEQRPTAAQFMRFLEEKKRSNKCPVCPHDGYWNFIVENGEDPGSESLMSLKHSSDKLTDENGIATISGVYYMECPNCGFMLHTSADIVKKFLAEESEGNG